MSNYSVFERKMAVFLSNFPIIKLFLKGVYQRVSYMRHKNPAAFLSDYKISKYSFQEGESFFGYYDKSPLNATNEYVVLHSANSSTKSCPTSDIPVDILLYDARQDEYSIIDKSYSYNWQQGARAMWLSDIEFIYNNFDKSRDIYISKIYNARTRVSKVIDSPIYDCYQDKFALSLNFDRLNMLRPDYGYRNKQNITAVDWESNDDDGIYYVDLECNTNSLILSFQDAINVHYKSSMNRAKHKFNHIMISPNGKKFIFLHRWFVGKRKFDSLMVANIDGSNIRCISDDDMVSHCFWRGDNHIFGFLRDCTHGDKYYMINIDTGEKNVVGKGLIDCFGDGHPHINGDFAIFDTYPNKSRMKGLYLYNFPLNSLCKIGEFYEGFEYHGEMRCDLHPRLSLDGKKVFFDSVHSGARQLYSLDIS